MKYLKNMGPALSLCVSMLGLNQSIQALDLPTNQLKCLIKKPLYVGASVTAAMGARLGVYNEAVSLTLGAPYRSMGQNPAALTVSAIKDQILPWTAKRGSRGATRKRRNLSQETNLARMFTYDWSHIGSAQAYDLYHSQGKYHSELNKASVVFAIDMFYWDAIYDSCGYGGELYDTSLGRSIDVETQITNLINELQKKKIPLVLGTVPQENAELIYIDSERLGINGMWYPQKSSCVESINKTIHTHCKKSDNCHVVDLAAIVEDFQTQESLEIDGQSYDYHDLRPDGVHLSKEGSSYLSSKILEAMEGIVPKSDCK